MPNLTEWLSILLLTRRGKWSTLERRMVQAAARNNRARLAFTLFVVVLFCGLPFFGAQYQGRRYWRISTVLDLEMRTRYTR